MIKLASAPSQERLINFYEPIALELTEVDRLLREQLTSRYPYIDELTSRVRLYQGKRIRPALLLLVAKSLGTVQWDHFVLGTVIEMIHAATLVHDDLLDQAECRRHVLTVHAEWGAEASVLLGDYLFSQAYFLAATLETPEGCRLIGQATNATCEGELRQVSRRGYFHLTLDEYIELISGKTAELISCACRTGAKFAGADPDQIESMARFGRYLGIAFQMADDILDIVGDPKRTGKSAGTDWDQRKMTLPLILLRDRITPSEKEAFRTLFHDETDRRAELVTWLGSTNIVDESQALADEYAARAAAELETLPPGPCRDRLEEISRFAACRAS
ncbi:polyprenyl synthetase family protein [bacterium]|jgi:octaprenyl-diphosphate synthase|nr:polyprenyl synthetase family protein [bacterium]